MSRIRTIKPEFWVSEQVTACSLPARLLFIGLWNFCDDNGVHPAAFKRLKGEVFPHDGVSVKDIESWISELINNNLLNEYISGDKSYWIVPTWRSHQRIEKPTYRYPLPNAHQSTTQHLAAAGLQGIEQSPILTPAVDNDSPSILQPFGEDSSQATLSIVDNSTNHRQILAEYSASPLPRNGMESNGKEGKNICRVADAPRPISSKQTSQNKANADEVQLVFNYWQTILNHPKAVLDGRRKKVIQQALKNYTVENLQQAILGCSKSKFHMGDNDQSKRYDDIALILRSASHIEKFIAQASDNSMSSSTMKDNDIFAGAI